VFAQGDRGTFDHLFVRAGELAQDIVSRGQATSWFAMRYWEGGPHVRVRLQDLDASMDDVVCEGLRRIALAAPGLADLDQANFYRGLAMPEAFTALGWHETGTVLRLPYVPETMRYGGLQYMARGEEMFEVSSRVAIRGVRSVIGGTSRISLGISLIGAYTAGLLDAGIDREMVATSLRRYAAGFAELSGAPKVDVQAARGRAERTHERAPTAVAGAIEASRSSDGSPSLNTMWAHSVQGYAQDLLPDSVDEANAASYAGAWSAIGSQWHMMANRLGISVDDEVYLAWLTSLAVLQTPTADAMHSQDGSAGRVFVEASKFRRDVMDQQAPHKSVSRSGLSMQNIGSSVVLPPPDPGSLALGSLADVLMTRCSTYGQFGGPITVDQLGTLLGLAAGIRGRYQAQEADQAVTIEQRTFPSAGGVFAIGLDVTVGDIRGLASATYRYDAGPHAVVRIGPDNRPDLARCTPYSEAGADGVAAVDVAHTPVVVQLHVRSREIMARYGQRGLRFALLEAGHLAQNLVLVATALGWSSITLGGFYDDELAIAAGLDGVSQLPVYLLPMGVGLTKQSLDD
jgi:thiopeptide-type bacteriocin biosynthesis protein